MSKKKILFVTNAMVIGGSTTSLLSILSRLDYSKYDVDLALYINKGELFHLIPKEVNLLPPIRKYENNKQEYFHRILSLRYMFHFLISRVIEKKDKVGMHGAQYLEYKDVEFLRHIDKKYDVAVAFLEGFSCKYVAKHIEANRKIAWIHVNYSDSGFNPKYDKDSMSVFDRIVLVSEDNKQSFDYNFPMLASKSMVIENILSTEFVRNRGKEKRELIVDKQPINLVTVCRITFESKALDRALEVFYKIKNEQADFNIKWYIVGDGGDFTSLKKLVIERNMQDDIVLLGGKVNPYPYLRDMDMFFLPSRREGKPMSVTEAFMMGLPALVTEYSSAREQVRDGVDGIIVENSEQGIYGGLLKIIEHPEIIDELKKNVIATDYSNVEEMKKVEALIDGEI